MSRRSRPSIQEPFVMLAQSLLASPAWREVSSDARLVLDRLMLEHMAHGGHTADKLKCTYANFCEHGIRGRSIAPAIRECEAVGLLITTEKGRHSISTLRRPSTYRLTFLKGRWSDGRQMDPTDEWRTVKTCEEARRLIAAGRDQKSAAHVRRALAAVRGPPPPRPGGPTTTA